MSEERETRQMASTTVVQPKNDDLSKVSPSMPAGDTLGKPGGGGWRRAIGTVRQMPATRLQMTASVAALVVVALIFEVQTSLFLSPRNITELLLQSVEVGVMALGMTFVLLVGEIDLSVAALAAVCATVTASAISIHHMGTIEGILLGLATGVIFELVQAALITILGAPSFVVTLGGSLALSGILLMILPSAEEIPLDGTRLGSLSADFVSSAVAWPLIILGVAIFAVLRTIAYSEVKRGSSDGGPSLGKTVILPTAVVAALAIVAETLLNSYLGVPLFLVIFIGMLVVSSYVTTQTRFGVHLYAVGGSRPAANRAGISPRKAIFSAFALNGLFAGAAGILGASRILGVGVQTNSSDLLLVAIAAAVVGGTSLFGGRGNVWGALIGAVLIEALGNGLDLLGAPTATKYIAEGVVLAVAAIVDAAVNHRWIFSRVGE